MFRALRVIAALSLALLPACSQDTTERTTTQPPATVQVVVPQPPPTLSSVPTLVDPVEESEILAIVEQIVDSPQEVFLPETLAKVADPEAILPPGSIVVAEKGTWTRNGQTGELIVTVKNQDGTSDRFVVVMIDTDQGWKIAYTVNPDES